MCVSTWSCDVITGNKTLSADGRPDHRPRDRAKLAPEFCAVNTVSAILVCHFPITGIVCLFSTASPGAGLLEAGVVAPLVQGFGCKSVAIDSSMNDVPRF